MEAFMKRLFAIALVLSMVFVLCPLGAFAETNSGTCGDNLTWCFDSETGALTISGEGEMYDYDALIDCFAPWFEFLSDIVSIEISEGVTSIGLYAFGGCQSITSITIPESVTSIGYGAFYYCTSLTSITIPESVTSIGDEAFYDCASLTSVTLPEGITSIGHSVFCGCTSLTSIRIPEGVTSIGNSAFYDCSNLTSIIIPESMSYIDYGAFHGCDSLETVYYSGAKMSWHWINIQGDNNKLKNAELISDWESEPEYVKGDVNGDGEFNMFDYVSLKNCVMRGTTDEALFARADINGDGIVNMFDYIAIKAAYFAQ